MQYIVNFAVPVIYMEFVFRALGIGQWLRSPESLRRPGLQGVLVEMTAEVRVEGSGMALRCNDERRLWAEPSAPAPAGEQVIVSLDVEVLGRPPAGHLKLRFIFSTKSHFR